MKISVNDYIEQQNFKSAVLKELGFKFEQKSYSDDYDVNHYYDVVIYPDGKEEKFYNTSPFVSLDWETFKKYSKINVKDILQQMKNDSCNELDIFYTGINMTKGFSSSFWKAYLKLKGKWKEEYDVRQGNWIKVSTDLFPKDKQEVKVKLQDKSQTRAFFNHEDKSWQNHHCLNLPVIEWFLEQ